MTEEKTVIPPGTTPVGRPQEAPSPWWVWLCGGMVLGVLIVAVVGGLSAGPSAEMPQTKTITPEGTKP